MATKYRLQNIQNISERKIFFDANVLIYIFWPSGSYHWESNYSSLFGRLLHQKNELVVDYIVISEIVNRAHRLEYDKYLTSNSITRNNFSYKRYRNSDEGQVSMTDIYIIIQANILNNFTVVGKIFSKEDIQSFLTIDSLDFSDKGILAICKENTFVLLTNDADYKAADIDILSSNPTILNYV